MLPEPILDLPLETRVMPNGVTLNVLRRDTQDVLRLDIVVEAGVFEQSQPLQCLFTNRLLREGTVRHSSSLIARRLDSYGAWLEQSVGSHYSFLTLYSLGRIFAPTARLLADILRHPAFPERRFCVVRDNSRSQFLIGLTRGSVIARRLFTRAVYPDGYPLGRLTEPSDYERLDTDSLRQFHSAFYTSGRTSLYLSGRVTPAAIATEERLFGTELWGNDEPSTESRKAVNDIVEHPEPSHIVETIPTLAQASVRMGMLMMPAGTSDYYEMRVLNAILGGYFGSRLMTSEREQKGYTYGIQSDLSTFSRDTLLTITCECHADKADALVTDVISEMQRLAEEPVPDEELDLVRNYLLGELCRNHDGVFSLADAAIYTATMGLPTTHLRNTAETIRTVTSVQLQTLAQRYFRPDLLTTVVVRP